MGTLERTRYGIMIDMETMGVGLSPAIMQIAAKAFDLVTDEALDTPVYNLCISLRSSVEHGLDLEADTLKFWLTKVPPEVFSDVVVPSMVSGNELPEALLDFQKWVANVRDTVAVLSGKKNTPVNLWGNGVFSDNKWLEAAYTAVNKTTKGNLEFPFTYREHMDMRTFMHMADTVVGFSIHDNFKESCPIDPLQQHDAMYDVRRQIAITKHGYKLMLGSMAK